MPAQTQVISVRQYGATGNGTTIDGPAIQAALNAAGLHGPCTVFFPAGRYATATVLTVPHDGVILQGEGMLGLGTTNGNPSTLVADPSHDSTPMLRIDPADSGVSNVFYRGTSFSNLSFDVSLCTNFTNTSASPPPVINLQGLSNCPVFANNVVFGNTGTALRIGQSNRIPGTSSPLISENLVFENFFAYGGYNSSATSSGQVPYAAGVVIYGSDNITLRRGLIAYNYINLPVASSPADIAAIQVIPAFLSTDVPNAENNGFTIDGVAITRYVVSIRLSSVNNPSRGWIGPQWGKIKDCISEGFNVILAINQENTSGSYGDNRGVIYWENHASSTRFGSPSYQVLASNLDGGILSTYCLGQTGDITLDQYCTGVRVLIGPYPIGSTGFFSATDAGTNFIHYTKNDLAGSIMTGALRICPPGVDPATTNGTYGNVGLQSFGDTIGLVASQRNGGPHFQTLGGTFGDAIVWQDSSSFLWYLGICVATGPPGTADWIRVNLAIW